MKTLKCINQLGASKQLAKQFTEARQEIQNLSNKNNFPGVLQLLVNILILQIEKGQIQQVIRGIRKIGNLYAIGNESIKYLIENLFVRSFRSLKRRSDQGQWEEIFKKLPSTFKHLYLQQNQQLNTHTL